MIYVRRNPSLIPEKVFKVAERAQKELEALPADQRGAFIKKAKVRLDASKDAFSGEQQPTMVQVKALFDELKARGVTYVEDPRVFDERGAIQRTRLPAEVLASTNAQCLEGTLLYASLMEAIGLQPVLVFKKGHAFIAWKTTKFDKTKDQLFFRRAKAWPLALGDPARQLDRLADLLYGAAVVGGAA